MFVDSIILMDAVNKGNLEVAKLLLENGADVDARDNLGDTICINVAGKGNLEVIKLLLENGADVNAKGMFSPTPLMNAVREENLEVIKLLLKKGADVNVKHGFSNQITALDIARKKGNEKIINLLINAGAK